MTTILTAKITFIVLKLMKIFGIIIILQQDQKYHKERKEWEEKKRKEWAKRDSEQNAIDYLNSLTLDERAEFLKQFSFD